MTSGARPANQARKSSSGTEASRPPKSKVGGPDLPRRAKKDTAKQDAGQREAPHHITPEEALENTRSLLAAKKARDRQPPPWQEPGVPHPSEAKGGYESDSARDKALELHRGEAGLNAIEGGISDRDHRRQGKRDSR